MHDPSKPYQELIEENSLLKRRIQDLEHSEGERKRTEQALIKSEAKIRREQKFAQLLLDTSPAFIVAIGFDGKVMMMNQALLKALEYTTEEIRGTDYLTTFVPEEERGMLTGVFREIIREEKKTVNENQIRSKSGRTYLVQWHGQGVMFDEEAPNFFVGVGIDISERKKAEEALRDSEEKYRNLIENANEAIFVALDGKLVFVNPMTVMIMGYSGEELVSKSFTEFIHQDDRDMVIDRHVRRMKGEETPNVYSFRVINGREGNIRWVELNSVLINWLGKPATLNFVSDVTERRQAEEALRESEKRYRELSIVDDLTQLYNSRHFYNQLRMEIDRVDRYGQPLTLLLLDLDDFKVFNDTYGHVEGDQVLSRLGQVVKRCLRQTDSAYRYGGEEFTILLPMTTSADGAVTAERIRMEFKDEIFSQAPGQDVHVTVSIGIGQYKPQEDMKVFVHRVDQLMYQGKKNGKNMVYSESWHQ
ncbi:MAG: diguanylate cyclase [Smithellaceae bacterium]|nr:diguanylate cyclase [Smithellaceae bacterium]